MAKTKTTTTENESDLCACATCGKTFVRSALVKGLIPSHPWDRPQPRGLRGDCKGSATAPGPA